MNACGISVRRLGGGAVAGGAEVRLRGRALDLKNGPKKARRSLQSSLRAVTR